MLPYKHLSKTNNRVARAQSYVRELDFSQKILVKRLLKIIIRPAKASSLADLYIW